MPRPRTHDDTVRTQLLDAASEAIAAGGSAALSLRSVASDAGTTTAAVYTLFGSRDALLRAVIEEGFRRFAAHLAAVPRTDEPFTDLLALGMAYRANALENPHFYRVMFSPDSRKDLEPRGVENPTFGVLRDAVVRATGAPADAAESMAVHLWALAHGMVSLELAGMLPGDPAAREQAYAETLRAARKSLG